MLNDTLMAAVAAERAPEFRHDAARQRRARRAPAGITRRAAPAARSARHEL